MNQIWPYRAFEPKNGILESERRIQQITYKALLRYVDGPIGAFHRPKSHVGTDNLVFILVFYRIEVSISLLSHFDI